VLVVCVHVIVVCVCGGAEMKYELAHCLCVSATAVRTLICTCSLHSARGLYFIVFIHLSHTIPSNQRHKVIRIFDL